MAVGAMGEDCAVMKRAELVRRLLARKIHGWRAACAGKKRAEPVPVNKRPSLAQGLWLYATTCAVSPPV